MTRRDLDAATRSVPVALVGPGGMGSKYIALLTRGEVPGLRLAAVAAGSPASADRARQLCGAGVSVFESEDALYAHAELFEAVIITTPHALHPAMAARALAAGKHVLVDKPAGVSLLACQGLPGEAAASGRVAAVMFHQRLYPKHRKLRELLDAGVLGRLYRVTMENTRFLRTAHYHASGAWRSSWTGEGGGALINQGQHLLDLWLWLFGMPASVTGHLRFGKYNAFRVDDEALLYLRYPDGMTGSFFLTTGEGTWTERLEIAGSKGSVTLDRDTLTLRTYDCDLDEYRAHAEVNAREALHATETTWTLPTERETHRDVLENFARAIRGGAPPVADVRDGVRAVELMNAAYLSAWLGQDVKLPLTDPAVYERELEKRREEERREC
ncbi:MAG: Gfo/Idh/MocA family oxidoreductase [Oscillospiraceae bacterium]|nr:Gfo/Idh/MocA family oxidoreductase [Oscillospiraceae bacterium]